jgi:class 3 adenylate cyclase
MATFMDRHTTTGLTPDDVARAHARDVEVQERFGVRFSTYLYDEPAGVTFCLVESPTRDAVVAAHTAAHGVAPEELIEVDPRAVRQFLGLQPDPSPPMPIPGPGVRVIAITDIVGSTANIERFGDLGAMELVLAHDDLVRTTSMSRGGREIDHTGDGMMIAFDSVSAALTAAIEIQRSIRQASTDTARFAVRIGLAAGEPVERSGRLFGAAVNLAARTCALGRAGEILVTSSVRDLAAGKGFTFEARGAITLKGFDRPVDVFAVDPGTGHRLGRDGAPQP